MSLKKSQKDTQKTQFDVIKYKQPFSRGLMEANSP